MGIAGPLFDKEGEISGAILFIPPSRATMTQSHGVPSSEKILRLESLLIVIDLANSLCSWNCIPSLNVSFIPDADCSLNGAITNIGWPNSFSALANFSNPGEFTPSSFVSNNGNLSMLMREGLSS